MTISGTGILWIVNRFLASLVRLDSFDVSSRRIRPRSICSRDCPSIISQIDSNEYPDCRTPRFSADPFDFTPRYIYIYFRSVERVDSRKEKEKEFFIFVHFVFEDGKFKRRYVFFQLKIATDEYSFRFGKSINSQGSSWEKRGCVRTKGAEFNPRVVVLVPKLVHLILDSLRPFLPLSLSFSTNRKISPIELVRLPQTTLSRSLDEIEERSKASRFPLSPESTSSRSSARFVEIRGNETCSIRLGYYRGLGHRTGFLESSAECAPDWTDTKDVVQPGYAINRPINFAASPAPDGSLKIPRPRKKPRGFPPRDKRFLSSFLPSFLSFLFENPLVSSRCISLPARRKEEGK